MNRANFLCGSYRTRAMYKQVRKQEGFTMHTLYVCTHNVNDGIDKGACNHTKDNRRCQKQNEKTVKKTIIIKTEQKSRQFVSLKND